jgi:hypothetical protein
MSTIAITVAGEDVGSVTVTETFDQSNSERFLGWLVATYGHDLEGNQRTPAEAIQACWASIRAGIFANVERREADLAAEAARQAVQPMESSTEVSA